MSADRRPPPGWRHLCGIDDDGCEYESAKVTRPGLSSMNGLDLDEAWSMHRGEQPSTTVERAKAFALELRRARREGYMLALELLDERFSAMPVRRLENKEMLSELRAQAPGEAE